MGAGAGQVPTRGGRILMVSLVVMVACGQAAPQPRAGDGMLPRDRLELPEVSFEEFRTLQGQLKGKPVVVNIWGSWCPPCMVEAPELARVSREFQDRVQFLGVDILDQRRAAREFILRFDWPYPSVFDPDAEIRDRLGFFGQPVTLIHDRRGRVAFEWAGTITADLLRTEIRHALAG
jgi:thiol-disulfide isomerase/thioredoxin